MLAFLQKITNTKGHVLYLCCAHIRFVTGTAYKTGRQLCAFVSEACESKRNSMRCQLTPPHAKTIPHIRINLILLEKNQNSKSPQLFCTKLQFHDKHVM